MYAMKLSASNSSQNVDRSSPFMASNSKTSNFFVSKKCFAVFLTPLILACLSFLYRETILASTATIRTGGLCDLVRDPFIFVSDSSKISALFEVADQCPIKVFRVLNGRRIPSKVLPFPPGTIRNSGYIYRAVIGSLENSSADDRFRIYSYLAFSRDFDYFRPADRAKSVKIGILGDNQDNMDIFGSTLAKMNKQHNVDAVIHVGDLVDKGDEFDQWEKSFDTINANSPKRIFMFSPGNHDTVNPPLSGEQTAFFEPGFSSATILSTKFLVLNSNNVSAVQIDWLKNELRNRDLYRFLVVIVHIAPFEEFWLPGPWKQGQKHWPDDVRLKLVPLFQLYNVDVVISGHVHVYQRGKRNGINYVITGGGGGKMDSERVENWSMYNVTYLKHHYCLMKLKRNRLSFEARDFESDRVIDKLFIEK